MGKRSRSYSSSSSSGYESDSHKRSRKDKGKDRERHRPSKSEQITLEDDFYAKSKEFRHWLSHGRSRPKRFSKMDAHEQRKYFKKFVKRWNRGKLDKDYYDGSVTGDKASGTPQRDTGVALPRSPRPALGPALGPSRPKYDDLALQEEAEADYRAAQRDQSRAEYKRNQREAKQEERESRATGRDRLMEKRAEKRESARAMAGAKEQGDMEFGDDYLMGGSSSSFAEAVRRRDASRQAQQRQKKILEKQAVIDEKRTEYQKKEDNTMAMFKAMAAARYGAGS